MNVGNRKAMRTLRLDGSPAVDRVAVAAAAVCRHDRVATVGCLQRCRTALALTAIAVIGTFRLRLPVLVAECVFTGGYAWFAKRCATGRTGAAERALPALRTRVPTPPADPARPLDRGADASRQHRPADSAPARPLAATSEDCPEPPAAGTDESVLACAVGGLCGSFVDAQRPDSQISRMLPEHRNDDRRGDGGLRLWCRPFNLADELERAIRFVAVAAKTKSIGLSLRVDANVRRSVQGDALRLRHLLVEFLSTAVRCRGAGSIVMVVSVMSSTRTRQLLRFSVYDEVVAAPVELASSVAAQDWLSLRRDPAEPGFGHHARAVIEAMNGRIGPCAANQPGCAAWFSVECFRSVADRAQASERDCAVVLCRQAEAQGTVSGLLRTLGVRSRPVETAQELAAAVLQEQTGPAAAARLLLIVDSALVRGTVLAALRKLLADDTATRVLLLGGTANGRTDLCPRRCSAIGAGDRVHLLGGIARALDGWEEEHGVPTSCLVGTGASRVQCTAAAADFRILFVGAAAVYRLLAQAAGEYPCAYVEAALSQGEALRKLADGRFDLVLLDSRSSLSNVRAIDSARRVQERRAGTALPIVALLHGAAARLQEMYRANGVRECIDLPFDQNAFTQLLRSWLLSRLIGDAPGTRGTMPPECLSVANLRAHYLCDGSSLWRAAEQWGCDALACIASIETALSRSDRSAALQSLQKLRAAAGVVGARLLRSGLHAIEHAIRTDSAALADDLSRLKMSCEITASRLLGLASRATVRGDGDPRAPALAGNDRLARSPQA